MKRASEIAAALASDARGVAQMLLPAGQEKSGEWVAGSVEGEEGKSLKVRLSGPRAGRWCDFACDSDRGDLLDLWAMTRHVPIAQALEEASEYLGIQRVDMVPAPQKPRMKAPTGAGKPGVEVKTYCEAARGLLEATISAYRVGEYRGALALPSFALRGGLQYIKYRSVTEKKYWSESGGKPCLFGWQAIPDRTREVVIAEGEIDAMSWYQAGYPALSPTNGSANLHWIDAEYDNLSRFDRIYLSFDMDNAGQEAVPAIVERLGRDRCLVVSLPHKDANKCLLKGVDLPQCLKDAKSMDPADLIPASRYADQVVDLFYPSDEREPGVRLPWQKVGNRVIFRPGEVSLLAGVNGHGKSELAGHVVLDAMQQGYRCCVASMEFQPAKWLRRLTRQASGVVQPTEAYIRAIHHWYDGRLWAFCAVGSAKADRILEVFEYAVRRYGVQLFVVDNLAKCGFAEDDYNGQKRFADRLTDLARDLDVHILLVAHMRKGQDENTPSGKMDVKGTGALTDMLDTVMVIWRNKKKDDARRINEIEGKDYDQTEKDALLSVVKQRNGEEEPVMALWFDLESHQFLGKHGHRPKRYVEWSATERVGGIPGE